MARVTQQKKKLLFCARASFRLPWTLYSLWKSIHSIIACPLSPKRSRVEKSKGEGVNCCQLTFSHHAKTTAMRLLLFFLLALLGLFLPDTSFSCLILNFFTCAGISQASGDACSGTVGSISYSLQGLATLLNNVIQNTTDNFNTYYYLPCGTVDSQIQGCRSVNPPDDSPAICQKDSRWAHPRDATYRLW